MRCNFEYSLPPTVKFSAPVEVHPIFHRREMSDDWIHHLERPQSHIAIGNAVYLMRTGVGIYLEESDHVCSGGYEHLYHEASTEYKCQVKNSRQVALAMQRILRRCGTTNPEMIARAYQNSTLRSSHDAYHQAETDNRPSLRGYVNQENTTKRGIDTARTLHRMSLCCCSSILVQ
jgi:hypothetical protein